ncbi:glycosyl transferase [Aureimonas endophytica]|uniref:Glycosyl transferase n=1 Tax=Aureimonas endophytica TaxID=2027858 RepID=A0A916ZHA3_9HYPH|nr:glycosyltransferase [Aureimonas endophytica]GGD96880.1 glycosyl transferase [Aureimonas endophytica]
MGDGVTIEARSPIRPDMAPDAVVVLPTFRRPDHLEKTLRSLEAQAGAPRFAVVVVENDAEGREGLAVARAALEGGRLQGLAIVAEARGNCHAYNAGWSTALAEFPRARFLLSIDDDECAGENWIAHLVATAEKTGADLVGAPQLPIFEGGALGGALARHPVFTPHYDRTGPVPILYSSGNVLVRRPVLEAMPMPFLDPAFNFTGGGDSDFYSRAKRRGFTFAWCQEAPVFETVPQRRTEFSWLQARSLRNGALSSIIEHRARPDLSGRLGTLAKSGALLAVAPLRALGLAWRTRSAVIGLYPLNVAIGRLMAEFGLVNEQYRRPEQN